MDKSINNNNNDQKNEEKLTFEWYQNYMVQ